MLTSTRTWVNDPARAQATFDQAKGLLAAGDRDGLAALSMTKLLEEQRAERDWWPDSTYFEDDDE